MTEHAYFVNLVAFSIATLPVLAVPILMLATYLEPAHERKRVRSPQPVRVLRRISR